MDLRNLVTGFTTGFIKNSRITITIILALLALGGYSYVSLLDREGFPSVDVPVVTIRSTYAVGDVQTVNNERTSIFEEALLGIEGIETVSSTTTPDVSVLRAEFSEGTTSADGASIISEELASSDIFNDIEYDIITIDAGKIDGENDLLFTVNGDYELSELESRAEAIALELEKSDAIDNAQAIKSTSLQTNPITGEVIEVQDSFTRIGYRDKDSNIVFSEAVTIGILGNPDLDSIELSDSLKDEMQLLEDDGLLEGLTVVYGGDPSDGLRTSISSLEGNAISGILAVVLVLFFLVNWKASIVTSVFIPLVMGGTFLALYLFGYTLNIISLFALILVLGLFVDDAIVIVEAIDTEKNKGKNGLHAIKSAINSVGLADVSGTLTTILVFLPTLFITGVLGDFIELIPITVIISLTISLFVALTIIPLISILFMGASRSKYSNTINALNFLLVIILGYAFLTDINYPIAFILVSFFALIISINLATVIVLFRRGKGGTFGSVLNTAVTNVLEFPSKVLQRISTAGGTMIRSFYSSKFSGLVSTILLLFISFVLIGGGLFAATRLEFAVFPPAKDSTEINIEISTNPGTTIQQAQEIAIKTEEIIADELGDDILELNYVSADKDTATSVITLTELDERDITSAEYADNLSLRFGDEIEGASVTALQDSPGPAASEFPFAVQIFDEDINNLEAAALDMETYLVQLELEDGTTISEVRLESFDVLGKKNGRLFTEVRAKVDGESDTGTIVAIQEDVESAYTAEKLAELNVSSSALEFDLGTESDNLESFNSAISAFIIALVSMYFLLMMQFNSFSQPLLIFMAIPLSFPVLFPGLLITNNPLSFFTILGMIGLAGIVVNNSIMLIEDVPTIAMK